MAWRRAALALLALIALAWTALWAPSFIDGFTTDCGAAASEVSDPCAYGRGLWLAGTVTVWAAGFSLLGLAGWAAWNRRPR